MPPDLKLGRFMPKIHTHYDNLKVARNAPPEVIRAAYKALAQRLHPDRNPNDPEAARIMAIINASYEVLSDPVKRRAHDIRISEQEAASPNDAPQRNQVPRTATSPQPNLSTKASAIISHVFRHWVVYGSVVVLFWFWATEKPSQPAPGPKPYVAIPPPAPPVYVRPNRAPNGSPWPVIAGYIQGFRKLQTNGLSSVTVDNSQNDSDVHVKLISLDGPQAYPVREFFIPAYSRFTLSKVQAGTYDIRYRDLSNGVLSRSETFTLEEVETNNGIRFSNMTMTLYKIRNGNMETYSLAESEF